MSRHNYTNPAFCQQSEFYPNPGSGGDPRKSPMKIYRSESVRSFKQSARIRLEQTINAPQPPKVGPKPQVNLNTRFADNENHNTSSNNSRYEHLSTSSSCNKNNEAGYALVPLSEISIANKGRYACIPELDIQKLHHNTTHFTRSQDYLDRYSSLSVTSNDNDHSFISLPPCPNPDNTRLKSAFSNDFGSKSLILVDQNSQQKYAIVPTEEDEELVDENHEIIQMHNGRAHRYAMIPTDDEETHMSSEIEMSPINGTNNNYATIVESPRRLQPRQSQHQQRILVHQSPQKQHPPPPPTPQKNTLATQKLHELLSTPQKPQRQGSNMKLTPNRYNSITSTPRQKEYVPQNLRYDGQQQNLPQCEQRTAVISPRLASLAAYSESSSVNKSWNNLSFQKAANANQTIGAVSLMLIICGAMNSGLCLYMITELGRLYYLDVGIISGFAAVALGILGFKSRQCDWLPNRNYISGYILVTVFSLLNCCGLLILLAFRPLPGDPVHDVTTGVVLGLSSLTLLLISLGVITSKWCRSPPPDNRVDVY